MPALTINPGEDMPNVWYDDHDVGHVFEFGSITLTKEDIIEFAQKYEPQPFHVDEEKKPSKVCMAASSPAVVIPSASLRA